MLVTSRPILAASFEENHEVRLVVWNFVFLKWALGPYYFGNEISTRQGRILSLEERCDVAHAGGNLATFL